MTPKHATPPRVVDDKTTGAMLPATPPSPAAPPAAGYVGSLIALLVLALGVIAVRDSAVSAGWLDGRPWTLNTVEWLDGLTYQWWMIPLGVIAILVGLWSVYSALRPRRRTALPLAARSSVWIGRSDLALVATRAAEMVPGVLGARSSATLRKVTVTVVTTAHDRGRDAQRLKSAVSAAVTNSLESVMAAPPKVVVRTRTGGR
ncbi:DUF6286 domain-containing protein [Mycolicibacterium baixiangningiae]|uniref:DUF6286 domain-containing protein n=1 Tax=Mycolicibacterium baixiangningiae TaxID=2761578 RepID=UPI001D01A791|nr:DUF6286 domain-containing protein [Mycolicibacterium baixiangningiae]